MAGLRLATEQHRPAAGAADKPSWDYLFARTPGTVHPSQKAAASLQDACLAQGDMVILSIEGTPQQGAMTEAVVHAFHVLQGWNKDA